MNIDVLDFKPEHAELFDLDEFGRMLFVSVGEVLMERVFATYTKLEHPSFTVMLDDEPLACAGIWIWDLSHSPRTGEAWAIINHDLGSKKPIVLTKAIRRGLDAAQEEYDLARIHATIDARNEKACRWAKLLGFECEGLMRKWLCGRDYFLYARLVK